MKAHTLKQSCFISLFALAASASLLANEMELSINEELIDLRLTTEYQQDFAGQFAAMHSDFDNLGSNQLSYEFYTQDEVEGFDVKLGAKGFWLDSEDDNGFGIALGLGASRDLTQRISAGVSLYYSPDIITGGDFNSVFEIDARLTFQLLENGALFFGHRSYEADNGSVDVDIYDDAYFGIKFEF